MQFYEIESGQICENYIFQCYHISDLNFLCSALTKKYRNLMAAQNKKSDKNDDIYVHHHLFLRKQAFVFNYDISLLFY